MVNQTHYKTLTGFYEYYAYAINHMRERYGAVQQHHGLQALDYWLVEAETITEHLLSEASEYGFTINQALAPIVFMDDWIRFGFPYVKQYSDEYEEIHLPLHLFTETNSDERGQITQCTRVILNDYVLQVNPEEVTAYSNDWYLVLIRKKVVGDEPAQQPIYEITNDLSNHPNTTTQHTFILDEYVDKYMGKFDALRKPYNDAFGIRIQLFVKACRIKNLAKTITMSGALMMKYKNSRIGYEESPGGFLPLEKQKAILVLTMFRIPVVSSTFVIVWRRMNRHPLFF